MVLGRVTRKKPFSRRGDMSMSNIGQNYGRTSLFWMLDYPHTTDLTRYQAVTKKLKLRH